MQSPLAEGGRSGYSYGVPAHPGRQFNASGDLKRTHMTSPRLALALVALFALFIGGGAPELESVVPADQVTGEQVAGGELRLRKLHLVRPDLIPYPLAVEHFC